MVRTLKTRSSGLVTSSPRNRFSSLLSVWLIFTLVVSASEITPPENSTQEDSASTAVVSPPETKVTAVKGSSPQYDFPTMDRLRPRNASGTHRGPGRPQRPQRPQSNSQTEQQSGPPQDNSTVNRGTVSPAPERAVTNRVTSRTPQSSLSSTSSPTTVPNRRLQFTEYLTDLEGTIEWTQPESVKVNLESSWEWFIDVPSTNGLVLEFITVSTLNHFSIGVYEVNKLTARPRVRPLWRYPASAHIVTMAPLLAPNNQLVFVVKGNPTITTAGLAQVKLTYAAHPVRFMPDEVRVDSDSLHPSRVAYDCSSFPGQIPKALQCDLVEQCEGGEDEGGCSYRDEAGCGDWVPYGDQCLKAFYQPITDFTPGFSHVTMAIPAEEACQTEFGARLATLPDEEGIQLIYRMIHQSGYQSASIGLRKMTPLSSKLKHLYKYVFQWGRRGSPMAFEQTVIQRENTVVDCAVFEILREPFIRNTPCSISIADRAVPEGFVCMKVNSMRRSEIKTQSLTALHLEPARRVLSRIPTKQCPDGSLVQTFHKCEWADYSMDSDTSAPPVFPSFQCTLGHSVPFSLVCDAIYDCADGSDEVGCMAPRFQPLSDTTFTCINLQTIPRQKRCNGISECFDASDEEDCLTCTDGMTSCPSTYGCVPDSYREFFLSCHIPSQTNVESVFKSIPPPASVELDGFGMSTLTPVEGECNEGYFQCDNGLCIPTFLVNNGEQDCPNGVDENIPPENVTCPGYYRCHEHGNCVHGEHVCDGIPHCPNQDDERYCQLSCPPSCTCEGYSYKCTAMIKPRHHLHARYLDVSGVVLPDLQDIRFMEYLVFLNLSHCRLQEVNLTSMPQLRVLDLSNNLLSNLSDIVFTELTGLQRLLLSNNPFVSKLDHTFANFIRNSGLANLNSLILTSTSLRTIEDGALAPLKGLTFLDLRVNDLTDFDKDIFDGMAQLKTLYADNYKLCCPYFHFATIPECYAPVDELSSCSDLLSGNFYRIFVWLLAALNIPANLACLVLRCLEMKAKKAKSYTVFVANLCLSDLLMGVYLIFIGSADVHYRNVWVSQDAEWKSSGLCATAGVLAFLSSEVSTFFVCLITIDRLLVICFPLKAHFHMTNRSASVACVVAWVLGLILALPPLGVNMAFYGQNGFCLPLPITRNQFPGQRYAFAIFIVFNFILFILIGTGQVLIYLAIKRIRMSNHPHHQDTTIASRLMLVVVTDFLCWFPIGLMGVLVSAGGVPIPGEVNVWAALFVLPFNSTLNPFLYTLNSVWGSHRERRMEKRIQKTIRSINSEVYKWPSDKVESLLRSCLRARVVRKEKVLQWLNVSDGTGEQGQGNEAYLHEVELRGNEAYLHEAELRGNEAYLHDVELRGNEAYLHEAELRVLKTDLDCDQHSTCTDATDF